MAEKKNPVITIEMTNGDIIKAELYPDVAPNTVNNFLSLVNKGFYNGLIFHRVIKGFMIQGGCPDGNGMGGPGYCIKGEFSHNGFQNDLAHTEGVLSMARAMNPNSAGSQFFIMHKDAPYLNGEYAAFGQVIDGMDIVNKIAEVRTGEVPIKMAVGFQTWKSTVFELSCIRKKLPEEIRQVCRRSRNNCRKYKKGDVLCRRPVMQL